MHYRSAVVTWLVLLLLLGLSLLSVHVLSGPLRYTVGFSCAVAMAACIMIVFMGLRVADGMLRLFAGGGFLWLAFLFLLTVLEVVTR